MTKAYQTGTRTAIVAQYATRAGHWLVILETNTPGVFYLIEETEGKRATMPKMPLIKNAQEIWEKYGIDLYSTRIDAHS